MNGAFGGSSGGVMTRDEQIAVVKAAFVAHCVQGIDGPLYEREGLWFEPLENWNLGVQWAVDGRWLASGLSWRIEASNHPIRTNYRRSGERGFEPGSRWIAEQIDITFSLEAVFSAEVLPRFLEVLPAAGFHDCLLTAEAVACLLTGRVRILLDVLAEHPSEAGPTVPIAERRAVGVAAASRSLDLPEDHCGWPIAVACVSRTALDRPLADSLREALEALMHLDRELGSARAGAPLVPHAASDRPARRPHATRPASEPAVGPPPSPPERTPVDRLLAVAEEDLLARFGPLRRIMHVPGGARPTGGELIRDHEGRYPYALPDYDDWYVHGVDHVAEGQAWGPAQKDVLWDRGLIAGTPVRPDFENEETRQWLRAMSPSIFKSRAVWIERNADWLGCVVQDSPRACGSVLAYKLGIGTSRSAPLGGLDADQSSLVCWAQFAATIELARFGALETLVGALNASPLCHGTGRSSADAAFHIGPVWDSPELIDASWDNMYRLPPFAGRVSGDDHWPPAGRPRRPFGALTAMAEFVAPTGAERQSFASFLDSFLARFLCAEQPLLTALLPERE